MPSKSKVDIESHILTFLEKKSQISLKDIAQETGLLTQAPKDRRAIQRVLAKLIKQGFLEAHGKARARVYILKTSLSETAKPLLATEDESLFNDIFVSKESAGFLQYFLKPIKARKPVGYNQDFLRLYVPNKTPYLSEILRNELQALGMGENIVRSAGTYARNILNRLLIDLSWNSSRLEGNTYSLLETKRLIELGETATGKDAAEAQMILNHKEAIEYIVEASDDKKISSHTIRSIHALLSENLLGDPSASGRIRELAVGITGTTYIPLENPHLLKECFDLIVKKINLIKDPFEQSFFLLVQLSYIQAFEDINKRTARLAANIPLIKANLKPLSFVDVSQKAYMIALLGVYEKNDVNLLRDLYVWAYKRSAQRYSALQQAMGQPNLFKLKYKSIIQNIIHEIIIKKVAGPRMVSTIKKSIEALKFQEPDSTQLFQTIETEIMSLHEGNIARFKIRPSEFHEWKRAQ